MRNPPRGDERVRELERRFRAEPTLEQAHAVLGALLRFMDAGAANLELDRLLRAECCPSEWRGGRGGAKGLLARMPGAYYGEALYDLVPPELVVADTVVETNYYGDAQEPTPISWPTSVQWPRGGPPVNVTEAVVTFSLDREPHQDYNHILHHTGPVIRLDLPDGLGRPHDWSHDTAEIAESNHPEGFCDNVVRVPDPTWESWRPPPGEPYSAAPPYVPSHCRGHRRRGILLAFKPSYRRGTHVTNGGGTLSVEYVRSHRWAVLQDWKLKPVFTRRQFVVAAAELYHNAMRSAISWGPSIRVSKRFAEVIDNAIDRARLAGTHRYDFSTNDAAICAHIRSEAWGSIEAISRARGLPMVRPEPLHLEGPLLTETQAHAWLDLLAEWERLLAEWNWERSR